MVPVVGPVVPVAGPVVPPAVGPVVPVVRPVVPAVGPVCPVGKPVLKTVCVPGAGVTCTPFFSRCVIFCVSWMPEKKQDEHRNASRAISKFFNRSSKYFDCEC
jgi:hypothetical protein